MMDWRIFTADQAMASAAKRMTLQVLEF